MTSFLSLPVELQLQCAQYVDFDTLKNLRLASRQTALNIGSEALFETVILRFNEESTKKFNQVLESKTLRSLVKTIIVNGEDGTWHEEDPDDDDYERTPWALAIPKISQFPFVKDVEIWFDEEVEADEMMAAGNLKQNEGYRRFYQELFYQTLGSVESVEGITVKNAQDLLISHTGEGEGFIAARKRLKKLAFLIQTEATAAPETDIEQLGFQECFNNELLQHWLIPTQTQLTSLSIFCDYLWNPNPFCDLRTVHFPNLVQLALGNWPVAFDWQIDWITSHGETLQELSLTDCPILYAVKDDDFSLDWPVTDSVRKESVCTLFSTRWSDVFPLFQQRLPRLTRFGFKTTKHQSAENYFDKRFDGVARIERHRGGSTSSYITYQGGIGPSPYTDDAFDVDAPESNDPNFKGVIWGYEDDYVEFYPPDEAQDELDEKALDQLLKTVKTNRVRVEQKKRENV